VKSTTKKESNAHHLKRSSRKGRGVKWRKKGGAPINKRGYSSNKKEKKRES